MCTSDLSMCILTWEALKIPTTTLCGWGPSASGSWVPCLLMGRAVTHPQECGLIELGSRPISPRSGSVSAIVLLSLQSTTTCWPGYIFVLLSRVTCMTLWNLMVEFAKQKYVMAMVLFFQYWSSNRVFLLSSLCIAHLLSSMLFCKSLVTVGNGVDWLAEFVSNGRQWVCYEW